VRPGDEFKPAATSERTCERSQAERSSGRLPSSQAWPWKKQAPGPRSQPCWRSGKAPLCSGSFRIGLLGLTRVRAAPAARMACADAGGLAGLRGQTFCSSQGCQPRSGARCRSLRRLIRSTSEQLGTHRATPVTGRQHRFKGPEEVCWLSHSWRARFGGRPASTAVTTANQQQPARADPLDSLFCRQGGFAWQHGAEQRTREVVDSASRIQSLPAALVDVAVPRPGNQVEQHRHPAAETGDQALEAGGGRAGIGIRPEAGFNSGGGGQAADPPAGPCERFLWVVTADPF